MKVLVTGGGGFIGKALVKQLIREGHTVRSLSRNYYPELREIGVEEVIADLQDQDSVIKALSGMEVVFHVGAKADIWGSLKEFYGVNVNGTLNVIKACRFNRIRYLIFTSSASVVFDGSSIEGMNEDLSYPSSPISPYTQTKALAEQAVLKANSADLITLSLRPHLVWGPGDMHILPRIIEQARAGKLRIIGDGTNLIDTTYIDNAVSAHICGLKALIDNKEANGKAYFISNGEPVLLWEMVNELLKVNGMKRISKKIPVGVAIPFAAILEIIHKILFIKSPPRLTRFLVHELASSHWFDITAARKQLGYNPDVSIKEGLLRLKAHLRLK